MPCLPPDRGYCRGPHEMRREGPFGAVVLPDNPDVIEIWQSVLYQCRHCSYQEVRRELAGVSAPCGGLLRPVLK